MNKVEQRLFILPLILAKTCNKYTIEFVKVQVAQRKKEGENVKCFPLIFE